uniref:TIR-like domain-containing protein n=1 Tax=Thermodesulfobacterium geofontis TaxID=1295609 RepID=A0A7C4JQB3_9BACT
MARRVFFSFHYERDIWRVNVVRNSWVPKGNYINAGFIDAAEFEKIKRQGDQAIKRWIDEQLEGTSVTVVLIGAETYSRLWVRYEIIKSFDRGNGLLGVYIHNIEDSRGNKDIKGENPFEYVGVFIDKEGGAFYCERDGSKWVKSSLHSKCSRSFDKEYWTGNCYSFQDLLKVKTL